jgi:tetratricopeptide (TPR) repeat protein
VIAAGIPRDRDVVPRWRRALETSLLGEFDAPGTATQKAFQPDWVRLDEKVRRWQQERSPDAAFDLIEASIVAGQPDLAKGAATFIAGRQEDAQLYRAQIANRILRSTPTNLADLVEINFQASARELKQRIHVDPRNSVARVDLALAYTSQGQLAPAQAEMGIALALAPDNRFVIRSAARLAVHMGDRERAHTLMARSARRRQDPWIAAAELATAHLAERPPISVRTARRMLDSADFGPLELSELTAAIATFDLRAGDTRRARRTFRRISAQSNENSVAQAEWASEQLGDLEIDLASLESPRAFEARARAAVDQDQWGKAVQEAWLWHQDQSFASQPVLLGSYAAAVGLSDFNQSAIFAERGLGANPHHPMLLNNLAFAFLELGDLDAAAKRLREMESLSMNENERAAYLATSGLLQYKNGSPDAGRSLYGDAIDYARQHGLLHAASLAGLRMAREELRILGPEAAPLVRTLLDATESDRDSGVIAWRRLLESGFRDLHREPVPTRRSRD